MTMFNCSRCGSPKKPRDFYSRTVRGKHYRRPECKDCSKLLSKEQRPREYQRRKERAMAEPEYALKIRRQTRESAKRCRERILAENAGGFRSLLWLLFQHRLAKESVELAIVAENAGGFRSLLWLLFQYRLAKARARPRPYVAWKHRLKRMRVLQGKCKCGQPVEGRGRCHLCLEKFRERERGHMKKHRAKKRL